MSEAASALRARIARLGGLPGGQRASQQPPTRASAAAPIGTPTPRSRLLGAPAGVERSLDHLGFLPEVNAAGLAWVRRTSVELAPFLEVAGAPAPVTTAQLLRLTAGAGAAAATAGGGVERDPGWGEDQVAVVDIESLGLHGSGVVAFLVGIGVPRGSRLEVDQVLLADMGAEPAQLLALLDRLARCRVIVTYNGRTFDLPILRSRAIVNRLLTWTEPPLHCDLLGPVRRLFRDRLGACTLRQAEQALLGFWREDDVPGSEAPARYRTWLYTGLAAAIEGVIQHNQLDLCTTMVLAARMAAHVDGLLMTPAHPADRYRLGLHLERRGGVADEVDSHLRAAALSGRAPWGREASLKLAGRLRRAGGTPGRREAIALLRRLVAADADDLRAARQLAIALERAGALEEALGVSERALSACLRLGEWRLQRMRSAPPSGWSADWRKRTGRLRTRVERAGRGQMPPPLVAAAGAGACEAPPLLAY